MRLLFLVLCFTYINCNEPVPTSIRPQLDGRIVGGEDVDIRQYPYQVSVQISGTHYCGGSIIGEELIITAAHCILSWAETADFSIRAGSSYRNKDGEVYSVRNIAKNPTFTPQNVDGDVAILRLSKPLEFSDTVASIEMIAAGEEIPDGDLLTVTGWGRVNEGGSASEVLKMVRMPKVSDSECSAVYHQFTPRMLCAGVPLGGKGTCQGDSGGPVVHENKLVGVVSFAYGCARPNTPSVFAKISALRTKVDEIRWQYAETAKH